MFSYRDLTCPPISSDMGAEGGVDLQVFSLAINLTNIQVSFRYGNSRAQSLAARTSLSYQPRSYRAAIPSTGRLFAQIAVSCWG